MTSPHCINGNPKDWNQEIPHNPRFFLHCPVCNFYADVHRTYVNPLGLPWVCGPCEGCGLLEPSATLVRHVGQQTVVSPPREEKEDARRRPWPWSMPVDPVELQFIGLSCANCDWDTIVRRETDRYTSVIVECWQCGCVDGTVTRVVGVVVFMNVERQEA